MNQWKAILPVAFLGLSSGCIPLKAIFLGQPDKKDLERFPSKVISASDDCFEFHPMESKPVVKVNDWTSDIPFFVSLNELAAGHPVRSFLVIQRDTIKYQYYGQGTNAESLNSSYSMAKSFTSALVGIAINEGHISGIDEKAVTHLPELAEVEGIEGLTINHLLNHTSGIKYDLPTDAQLYYGNDILKSLKRVQLAHKPGTYQHYLNINIQLLGLIIDRATGKSPAKYLEEKIWKPMGACNDAKWLTDKNGIEKTFCCLGATALDYAKFGRLMLKEGNWNGNQLIPSDWHQTSTARDTTEGSSFNYNRSWHIGLKEYNDYMAIGLYKQHIYVNPEKEIAIVLLNDKDDKLKAERVNWWYVFRQIADQL